MSSFKTMWIGGDQVCKATLQRVWREYELLSFHEREPIEDFTMWLNNLTNQLATLGYKQLVISIETLLDSANLSVEEITGRLKAAEDNVDVGNGSEVDKFYLIEE
jgi:hypothetical protein